MRKCCFVIQVTVSMLLLGVFLYSGNGQVWAKDPNVVLAAEGKSQAPRAILKTKFGEMEIVFFPELAPKHVESPGYTIPAEFNKIPHERGIVSAARTADPNSAGSQFFIMVAKSPHLDGQYTVFGEVVKGIEVADKIVSQPRDRRDMPLERIEITVDVVE